MSHRTAEVSSSLAPDPEQLASPVAPKHTPWSRKMLPRWFVSNPQLIIETVLVIVLVVILTVLSTIKHSIGQTPPDGNGVSIVGEVVFFDWLVTQQLSVMWSIYGHGEYGLTDTMGGESNAYSAVNRAVDVYLNDPTKPAFSYDPTLFPTATTGNSYAPESLVSFNTVHKATMNKRYYAPFARFKFTAFAFVIDKATNASIPITGLTVGDPGPRYFETISYDAPARNNFTYSATSGPSTVEVESRMVFGTTTHSVHAAALIFLMFVLCWGLCFWSMYIVWTVSRRGLEAKDGIAFLPITLIFAIPTIRGLYLDWLPFGIFLDVVGLFSQMMISFFCAASVLASAIGQATNDKIASPPEKEKV